MGAEDELIQGGMVQSKLLLGSCPISEGLDVESEHSAQTLAE